MYAPSFAAERIADVALATFDALPSKCKPRKYSDGRREWTPMSAIVVAFENEDKTSILKCISLATGTKCLPASSLEKCYGTVLHDCHAEILSLRGFNYWLLSEIQHTLENGDYQSVYVERCQLSSSHNERHIVPTEHEDLSRPSFRLSPGISIYLFSTTAPCGDASMELLISSKTPNDAVPWSAESLESDLGAGQPLGRGHFSLLGAMRRKPARADAEATLSQSCSDKIALKQITGLVTFPGDLLVNKTDETFLTAMVVYPGQFSEVGYARAFEAHGRLKTISTPIHHQTRFFDIKVLPDTYRRFEFSQDEQRSCKVTNLSALWIAGQSGGTDIVEVLVNGVKQGHRQFDSKRGKASAVARRTMVEKFIKISLLLHDADDDTKQAMKNYFKGKRYSDLKGLPCRRDKVLEKSHVVRSLGGWSSNSHEDDFEVLIDFSE